MMPWTTPAEHLRRQVQLRRQVGVEARLMMVWVSVFKVKPVCVKNQKENTELGFFHYYKIII